MTVFLKDLINHVQVSCYYGSEVLLNKEITTSDIT